MYYLCRIYSDFMREPVAFSAELPSGITRMKLANKARHVLWECNGGLKQQRQQFALKSLVKGYNTLTKPSLEPRPLDLNKQIRAPEHIELPFFNKLLLHRHERFTGKYATRKIHENYIWDPSGLHSIISHVSLSMTYSVDTFCSKMFVSI